MMRFALLTAATAATAAATATAAAASPPNIVLLMADQLRFDAIGAARNAGVRTPNLDALAADGLRFRNGYSSTPTCTPARAALLTGNSPWQHGMLGYGIIAPAYPTEMPSTLASLGGYSTASIGKNHFILGGDNTVPPAHGYQFEALYDGLGTGFNTTGNEFDTYDAWFQSILPGSDPLASGGLDWNSWNGAPSGYEYPEAAHPTAWVGRTASSYIANYSSPDPFFLKVSFHRPHSPYDPPARLLNATSVDQLPPIHAGSNWDSQFADGVGCGPSDADAWCGLMPEPNLTLARRAYYASISFVDEWVGEVVDALKAKGLYDEAWILFISDHGDGQGDHYHWRKGYPYEFSAHVPMMIRWPTSFPSVAPRNSTTDLIAELRDVFPTTLAIAGITPPAGTIIDGLPWTCVLLDPSGATCETPYERRQLAGNELSAAPEQLAGSSSLVTSSAWRQWIDGEHDICYNASVHWSSLTDGKVRYVFLALTAGEQLFDLTVDPYEMNNLAADPAHASVLALWRSRMVAQFEAENRGPRFVVNGTLVARPDSYLYSPNYPKAFLPVAREMEERPEFKAMRW
jgi:arylsulfatase